MIFFKDPRSYNRGFRKKSFNNNSGFDKELFLGSHERAMNVNDINILFKDNRGFYINLFPRKSGAVIAEEP